MKKLALSAAILFVLAPISALAAEAAPVVATPSAEDPLALIKAIVDAVQSKNWLLIAPLVILLAIWIVRWGAKRVAAATPTSAIGRAASWLTTDRGGALLSLLSAVGVALLSAALVPGATLSQVLAAAGAILLGNQALFGWLKKLLFPSGTDAAEQVRAVQAAVVTGGSTSSTAAADALNEALLSSRK